MPLTRDIWLGGATAGTRGSSSLTVLAEAQQDERSLLTFVTLLT